MKDAPHPVMIFETKTFRACEIKYCDVSNVSRSCSRLSACSCVVVFVGTVDSLAVFFTWSNCHHSECVIQLQVPPCVFRFLSLGHSKTKCIANCSKIDRYIEKKIY